jgi:antitoxin component of RelBE/YafQ-DinJ toxin-antitoxin module
MVCGASIRWSVARFASRRLVPSTKSYATAAYALTQVRLHKGLPFEVRLPNAATQAAISELESGKGKRFSSVEALFDDLDD